MTNNDAAIKILSLFCTSKSPLELGAITKVLEAMQPTYTNQKPTEPGWYWLKRERPENFEAVVRVELVSWTIPEKGSSLVCAFMTSPFGLNWVFEKEWQPDCLWAGPIQPPQP